MSLGPNKSVAVRNMPPDDVVDGGPEEFLGDLRGVFGDGPPEEILDDLRRVGAMGEKLCESEGVKSSTVLHFQFYFYNYSHSKFSLISHIFRDKRSARHE